MFGDNVYERGRARESVGLPISEEWDWLTPHKSRYNCLIWIMHDRRTNSSPPAWHSLPHNERFIANDIIMSFVIIPGAINRVIRAMCVSLVSYECVRSEFALCKARIICVNPSRENKREKKTLKRQHSHKNCRAYVSNFWSNLCCCRDTHKILY